MIEAPACFRISHHEVGLHQEHIGIEIVLPFRYNVLFHLQESVGLLEEGVQPLDSFIVVALQITLPAQEEIDEIQLDIELIMQLASLAHQFAITPQFVTEAGEYLLGF